MTLNSIRSFSRVEVAFIHKGQVYKKGINFDESCIEKDKIHEIMEFSLQKWMNDFKKLTK